MEPDRDIEEHEKLRRLAASDPKRARTEFQALMRLGTGAVEPVLTLASRPGEGRLRQMIAIVFKMDRTADILDPWLRRWLEVESDEFTRTAIANALATRKRVSAPRPASRSADLHALEAYQFVSSRLSHRVRNAMALPNAQITRLEQIMAEVGDEALKAELSGVVGGLKTGFSRISRTVEFDTGDDYLVWQSISLIEWLYAMEAEFATKIGFAKLRIVCAPAVRRATIRATRFLLETIFANLWSNAVQVTDGPGTFVVEAAADSERRVLDIIILDEGVGFPESDLETAFQQVYSTKSQFRGRGLLEIADAVKRLEGKVELRKRASGDYRIGIVLPLEGE